jgi:hypothetical protein
VSELIDRRLSVDVFFGLEAEKDWEKMKLDDGDDFETNFELVFYRDLDA